MPAHRQTPRYVFLAVVLGIALSLSPSCRKGPTSLSEAPHRTKTGSVLLTFDPSINGRENEAELWTLMIELTTKRAKGLGGESEVHDLGNHRLRVVFFDHQEHDLQKIRRQLLGLGILEFRLVHPTLRYLKEPPPSASIPDGYEVMSMICDDAHGQTETWYYLVLRSAEMTETAVLYAEAIPTEDGNYMIVLHLSPEGRTKLASTTGANIGRNLGIIFDGRLVSAPRIHDRIESDSAQVTGSFSQREALEFASLLTNPLGLPATLTVEQ